MILGSGNAISAGFRIFLRDEFSQRSRSIGKSLSDAQKKARNFNDELLGAKRAYGSIALGGAAATAGMVRLAFKGAEFGYQMDHVLAITKASNREFRTMKNLGKSIAGQTIFRPDAVASAMDFAAMAGQDATTIMSTISPATYMSAATMTPLGGKGGGMDILTNIMKGFGIPVTKATYVADLLTEATLSANTNLVDLGRAMKYTAATAVDTGTSLKETTAMVMGLGNAGMQSSQAGTAVENMLRYFTRAIGPFATGAQHKALGMLGFNAGSLKNADGSMRDMSKIFKMMAAGAKGLEKYEVQAIYEKIFGVRGKRSASALIRMVNDYDNFIIKLTNSQGRAQQTADDMMRNLKGEWEKTVSAWESFAASWSEALSPVLTMFLRVGRWFFDGLSVLIGTPVLGTVVASLTTMGMAVLSAAAAIKLFRLTLSMASGSSMLAGARGAALNLAPGFLRKRMNTYGATAANYTTKYSKKRGMFYSVGGGLSGGANWQSKTMYGSGMKTSKAMSYIPRIGGYLGKVAKFLPMFLGIGGMGLAAVIGLLETFAPQLINAVQSLVRSQEDNTAAITSQYDRFKGVNILPQQAVMAAYGRTNLEDVAAQITIGLEALRKQGKSDAEVQAATGIDILNALLNSDSKANINPHNTF